MGSYVAWGLAHLLGQNLCNALYDPTILVVAQGLEPAAEIVSLHQHQAYDSQKN